MSFRYYKHKSGEYYRVHPNDHYEYYPSADLRPIEQQVGHLKREWTQGIQLTWTKRYDSFLTKPIEVSELEVLVVLGPEAVE